MNYSVILYVLGMILKAEGIFLLLPAIVGLLYREDTWFAYLIVGLASLVLGFLLNIKKGKFKHLYAKEGFITVSLGWLVMSAVAAVPYVITGEIPFYIDAWFEMISGFTTTGASILTDVEAMSHAGIFWRSFTHWIGGMGVFVFILAILPMIGGTTMNLMKAESPGPSVDKFVPHVKDTAKILYLIYLALTIIEIILLLIFGMSGFDAVTITFGTVGTGGFGIKNDSMASYAPALQNIVTIFMILSGVNFSAYFCIISKRFKEAFGISEVRWYLGIILASVGIITLNVRHMYGSVGETLRHAFFQVGSIITTTGYATTDFNLWPELSKMVLLMLMFCGACAGSTGGGMKVSRLIILFKTIKNEVSLALHPRAVRKIRVDGRVVKDEVLRSANVYLVIYFFVMLGSVLVISLDNFGFTTNFTAVIATLNNIGPGLDLVGPTGNFAMFSPLSKLVLMFDMLAGRLELFPIIMMLTPTTWKKQ